uniref:Heat shock factor 2-binding protein-like n=1 Tax=Neolamprologus brichardi TaxID=32507 RepID=A0A3Q4HBZ7_NEOBR
MSESVAKKDAVFFYLFFFQGGFIRVRKRDLEKLTTEVMQLREFLPRVVNGDLMEMLHKEHIVKEQMRQECLHLQSRLDAVQTESQKEKEEKLLLREQLWQSRVELQQQADFCSGLGSAACSLLWSCSAKEDTVSLWLADVSHLQSFVSVCGLGLLITAGIWFAEGCSSRFPCSSAAVIMSDYWLLILCQCFTTVMLCCRLMLMALYNVSISLKGLKYLSENQGILPLIWNLLDDGHWEVCLHSLRLLQSMLLEDDVLLLLGSSLLDPDLCARVSGLAASMQPSLRLTALQTLEDLQALQQVPQYDEP